MKKISLASIFALFAVFSIAQQNRIIIKLNGSISLKTLYPSLSIEYGKVKNSLQLEIGAGHLASLKEYQDVKYIKPGTTGGYLIDGKDLECVCKYNDIPPSGLLSMSCKSNYNGLIGKLFYTYYFDISNNRTIGLNGLHVDIGIRYQNILKKCEEGFSPPPFNGPPIFYRNGQLLYSTLGPLAQLGYQFIVLKWLVIDARLAASFNYASENNRSSADPLIGNLFEFSLSIGRVFPYKK